MSTTAQSASLADLNVLPKGSGSAAEAWTQAFSRAIFALEKEVLVCRDHFSADKNGFPLWGEHHGELYEELLVATESCHLAAAVATTLSGYAPEWAYPENPTARRAVELILEARRLQNEVNKAEEILKNLLRRKTAADEAAVYIAPPRRGRAKKKLPAVKKAR